MRQVGFAYAHARLQARLAQRPSALDWQMIETGRDFAQSLDAASHGPLARYVSRLGRESDRPAVEDALRQAWADLVAEVASFVPGKWRAALLWITPLPHLRLIEAGRAPKLAGAEALQAAIPDGSGASEAWREGFAARLPAADPGLAAALAPMFDRFLEGPPRSATDTPELSARLETLFRSRPQQPIAVFAFLGLMAVMIERLRGALILAGLFAARDTPSGETGAKP